MTNNLPCNEPNILKSGQYKTDLFNKNPLFVVRKEKLLGNKQIFLVRSWQEAFALHGKAKKEDINPKYIRNNIKVDVILASHCHQVPQVGMPQIEPEKRARNVDNKPIYAAALIR